MSHYRVGCDAHKHYSVFALRGQLQQKQRVNHDPGAIRAFLSDLPEGTPVALESIGNGHIPAISGLVLPAPVAQAQVDRRRDRLSWPVTCACSPSASRPGRLLVAYPKWLTPREPRSRWATSSPSSSRSKSGPSTASLLHMLMPH